MTQKFDLVIFDCDGVLLDSELIACAADAEALSNIGFEISPEEIARRFAGVPGETVHAELEKDLGSPLPDNFGAEVKRIVLAKYRTELQAIDGAEHVLKTLETKKCIASSSAPANLALGLVETGLFELVYPHIFSTRLVARGKPHPDIFEYAANVLAVPPDRCLVVEDSVAGVTAAQAAGMACVGFSGGSHCSDDQAERLRNAGAYTVLANLRQLLQLAE